MRCRLLVAWTSELLVLHAFVCRAVQCCTSARNAVVGIVRRVGESMESYPVTEQLIQPQVDPLHLMHHDKVITYRYRHADAQSRRAASWQQNYMAAGLLRSFKAPTHACLFDHS